MTTVLTTAGSVSGQALSSDPPADDETTPDAPQKVDVQPLARDDEIADRLGDILRATGWFAEARAEVQDGVVWLHGAALNQEYRAWATELANSTQDVAAVVNRMTLQQRPVWDVSPAVGEIRGLLAKFIQSLPLILFGLVILGLSWFAARGTQGIVQLALRNRVRNGLLRSVVAQAAMLPVLLIGLYVVLRVSGLTQLALTVLGGTGVAGLIIGIAFREIAENFLASLLISTQNPFRNGDLIEVADQLGFVQRVSTRGTLLMTHDGNHVQIPNSVIYKSTIKNFTASPNRRIDFRVGVGYDASLTGVQSLIKQLLDDHPAVLRQPESRVLLEELGSSSVVLQVSAWLDGTQHNPDAVRSSLMRMVKQSLLAEGISLPDDAREIVFPEQVPVRLIQSESDSPRGAKTSGSSVSRDTESVPAEEVWSDGEGGPQSDAAELQREADRSWLADEGENLLKEDTPHCSTPPVS
jgi:small-conductance mechanosensitive channel